MTASGDEHGDARVAFLEALLETRATIAGDVTRISLDTWAIHGTIAGDGAMVLAEFETYHDARVVLDQLPARREIDEAVRPSTSRPTGARSWSCRGL
jgi:hypothetical protein